MNLRLKRGIGVLGLACVGLIGAGVLAGAALGQQAEDRVGALGAPAASPVVFDVSFQGGTLKEFVEAVRQGAQPNTINVVLRDNAEAIPVPAVSLKRVTGEAAFQAVVSLNYGQVQMVYAGAEPIVVVQGTNFGGPPRAAVAGATLETYPIRDISLSGVTTDDVVLDALRVALETAGGEKRAEVLHHVASGVVFVRGTEDQHRIATDVLRALREDAHDTTVLRSQLESRHEDLLRQLSGRQSEAQHAKSEYELAKRRHERFLAEVAQNPGEDAEDSVLIAESELTALENRATDTASEVEETRQRLKSLEASMYWRQPAAPLATMTIVAREVTLEVTKPDAAAAMFEAFNGVLEAVGGRGRVTVKAIERESGKAGSITVEFSGEPMAGGAFTEFCTRVGEFDKTAR